jgi:hypothetical protein
MKTVSLKPKEKKEKKREREKKRKIEIYEYMEFFNKLKPITYIKCSAYLLTFKIIKNLNMSLP